MKKLLTRILMILVLVVTTSIPCLAKQCTSFVFMFRMNQQTIGYLNTNHSGVEYFNALINSVNNPATWAPGFSKLQTGDLPAILAESAKSISLEDNYNLSPQGEQFFKQQYVPVLKAMFMQIRDMLVANFGTAVTNKMPQQVVNYFIYGD